MSKSSLRTIPQHVAAVGLTVDGREITEQDIDDIVELYNPSVYGARINLDHYGNWGAWAAADLGIELNGCMLGDVISVTKEKTEDGTSVLAAVLCPNESLLKLNQADQAVYYSIEINRDFMGSGKTYLTGLAMTDYPASTRTTRANFSKNDESKLKADRLKLSIEQQSPSLITSIFNKFQKPKEEEMNQAQLSAALTAALEPVSETLTEFKSSMAGITDRMATIENQFKIVAPGEEQAPADNENTNVELSKNEDFTQVQNEVSGLTEKFTTFEKQINTLSEKFEKALKTPADETTESEDESPGDQKYAKLL